MIEDAERPTASNTGLNLTFAFNYGGQEEIAAAARELARTPRKAGSIRRPSRRNCSPSRLFTSAPARSRSGHPHQRRAAPVQFPALAGGLCRVLFVDTLWPDFGRDELLKALQNSPRRDRRFGAVNSEAVA